MSLILTISVATCTSSVFVHLEKYALRNPGFQVFQGFDPFKIFHKFSVCASAFALFVGPKVVLLLCSDAGSVEQGRGASAE